MRRRDRTGAALIRAAICAKAVVWSDGEATRFGGQGARTARREYRGQSSSVQGQGLTFDPAVM